LDKLQTLHLGGFEVEKEGVAVIEWTIEVEKVEAVLNSIMGMMQSQTECA